jgi:hypothetical protein
MMKVNYVRDIFSGYYRPTETDFQEMWREGSFVLDANSSLVALAFCRLDVCLDLGLQCHSNPVPTIIRRSPRKLVGVMRDVWSEGSNLLP